MIQSTHSNPQHLQITLKIILFLGPDLQNILRQSYDNAKVTIDLR